MKTVLIWIKILSSQQNADSNVSSNLKVIEIVIQRNEDWSDMYYKYDWLSKTGKFENWNFCNQT